MNETLGRVRAPKAIACAVRADCTLALALLNWRIEERIDVDSGERVDE